MEGTMKHTARFLAFLLVLVMMLTAVACGGTKEPAGEERAKHGAPSIFWTFVIGIAMALVFTGFASIGLQIWDDTPGKIIVISANLLPIAGNIAAYSLWGVGRGIILSVFCAAIVGLTVFLGWNRD